MHQWNCLTTSLLFASLLSDCLFTNSQDMLEAVISSVMLPPTQKNLPSILRQSVTPHQLSDQKSEYTAKSPLLLPSVVRCFHLNTIKTVDLVRLFLKRVESKNVKIRKKWAKSGNLSTETAKPKFWKIRQKSIFGPTLTFLTSKFSEEQGLSEKFG